MHISAIRRALTNVGRPARLLAVGAACSAVFAVSALGDTLDTTPNFKRDRNVSVSERPRPEYDPVGIRVGGFMLLPDLQQDAEYNDNIFAVPSGKQSDAIFRTRLEAKLKSLWSNHELRLFGWTQFNEFAKHSSESTTDFDLGGSGRIDIQRSFSGFFGGDYGRLTEPRTSTSSPTNTVKPIRYDSGGADLGLSKVFNRLMLMTRFDYRNYDFKNGVDSTGAIVPQDERDRAITSGTARAEYAVSPDTAVFLQGVINQRDYDQQPPLVPVDRNSSGYTVGAGANFDLAALVRGEVLVGYLAQDYRSPSFKGISGLAVQARVEWFPTDLISLTFYGDRSVEDATQAGASGYLATKVGAGADYELLRNLIIHLNGDFENDAYKGIDRDDNSWHGRLGFEYLMSHLVSLSLNYDYINLSSSGTLAGRDFAVNDVSLRLILHP